MISCLVVFLSILCHSLPHMHRSINTNTAVLSSHDWFTHMKKFARARDIQQLVIGTRSLSSMELMIGIKPCKSLMKLTLKIVPVG
jgi:K+-sensing histidine kinase KdpD